MAWIRRRGNSFALIESYREGGKVKQRYVRTLTHAEAQAWLAASGRGPVATPTPPCEAPCLPIPLHPPAPLVPPDTTPPGVQLPADAMPRRSLASPVRPPSWCQMCGAWLPLGGALCPRCTGALVRRPAPSVCEGCQGRMQFGGWRQRFCCRGCLAGQPHTEGCALR
jgi:hypothetical protein